MRVLSVLFLLVPWFAMAQTKAPPLQMPIDCELGKTCVIQQFVDHILGDAVGDYGCGGATYNGHKGTDFRVTDPQALQQGVAVLAAAGGRVKGARNDQTDFAKRTAADLASTNGKECGNGVVIEHGYGWETQYCHMRKGSVRVARGDSVVAGDVIGVVGLSGKTQFPHLHISVRYKGEVIDPFTSGSRDATCTTGATHKTLWEKGSALARYQYQPTKIINLGFANGAVKTEDVENGRFEEFTPSKNAKAIVGYLRAVNLRKGDRLVITLRGPDGVIAEKAYPPLDKSKAVILRFLGKKRPASGWPNGAYSVYGIITRGQNVLTTASKARIAR